LFIINCCNIFVDGVMWGQQQSNFSQFLSLFGLTRNEANVILENKPFKTGYSVNVPLSYKLREQFYFT